VINSTVRVHNANFTRDNQAAMFNEIVHVDIIPGQEIDATAATQRPKKIIDCSILKQSGDRIGFLV
jgi:hypothetical protein